MRNHLLPYIQPLYRNNKKLKTVLQISLQTEPESHIGWY
nr:MAG TPA: hypothetical protein [Herelleviridae sp.]